MPYTSTLEGKTVSGLIPLSGCRLIKRAAWLAVAVLFSLSVAAAETGPHGLRLVELRGTGVKPLVGLTGATARDLAVADRLLVGLRRSASTAAAAASSINGVRGTVSRKLGTGRIVVVDLPANSDILAVAEELSKQPGIEFAEPDRLVHTTVVPSDPEYGNQPHLPKIQCPTGWDIGTGSPNVVIAVIDSGIDTDHPDLASRLWTNPNEIPGNGIDDDNNGYVDDVHGWNAYDWNGNIEAIPDGIDDNHDGKPDEQVNHGTLVAGLAAAAANGFGTVGVTWQASIMPVKVFDDDGDTLVSTVVDGMYYASQNGAHIMNLSIGAHYEQAFTDPIVDLWNRGGLTVSAGGNEGDEITDDQYTWTSPACNNGPDPLVDNMNLGVGGLTLVDTKASWSNIDGSTDGNFVEVFAPGVNLYGSGVYYPSVPKFSTYYTTNSGTSFSAPLVTGLAALLKAQDMSRTGADLLDIIRNSCDDIDWRNIGYAGKLGSGRINVARAMGAQVAVAAPGNLRAFDTPGDQGGSITLTWSKSVDDGGGSNTVTGYAISRADGALPAQTSGVQVQAGTWEEIATVPKGTTQFVDTPVSDGKAYFYRVAAIAPDSRSESEAVGPVFAYDDSAPPRVDTLHAYDRPVDDGGAIELDWTAYQGTGDLAQFHVYCDNRPFNSVYQMTPVATLDYPEARSYTHVGTTDGVDYYYAVVAVDGLGNMRKDVLSVGPIQSFANGPVTFAAGLHMLGTQAVPADKHPATLFGLARSALHYARYRPGLNQYIIYNGDPLDDFLKLELGRGFWIKFDSETTFVPDGATAPAGSFTADVAVGWNQLANPFFGPIDFDASSVTYNGNTMDMASADTLGIMAGYAWAYNRDTDDYRVLHPLLGAGTTVATWQGMWVLGEKPCTLTMNRATGAASANRSEVAAAADEWPLQIIARGAGSVDASNYCGVSSAPSGIQSPPRAGEGVELYFPGAGGSSGSARCATAFNRVAAGEMSWRLNVAWTRAQDSITLSWPDLSRVPRDYSLTLEDLDTGKKLSMRHQTGYTMQARSDSGVRHLAINASKTVSGAVRITSMSAQPTAGGAQVAFTLSKDAACDVEVMNIAGRPIRAVESANIRSAGTNVAAWDGRNYSGSKAPPGQYLVRITAQSEDGTKTSALRSVRIQH